MSQKRIRKTAVSRRDLAAIATAQGEQLQDYEDLLRQVADGLSEAVQEIDEKIREFHPEEAAEDPWEEVREKLRDLAAEGPAGEKLEQAIDEILSDLPAEEAELPQEDDLMAKIVQTLATYFAVRAGGADVQFNYEELAAAIVRHLKTPEAA